MIEFDCSTSISSPKPPDLGIWVTPFIRDFLKTVKTSSSHLYRLVV